MRTFLTRRKAISAAAGAALVGCRSEARALAAADTHPSGYPTVEAVAFMGRRLSELTGGKLSLRAFPGGQLGEEKDSLELTIFGGIDINRVNLAPLNNIAPLTKAAALPFLFRSIAHMRRAMDGAPGEKLLAALEPHGLIGLCFYESGARNFYTIKRPVHTPDDLKGLKIRVQSADLYVGMVRALGANPTPMPYGEVYQGLVQGVVDGAENNWPSFESSRHYEVARHVTLTGHVMAPEVLVMSAKRWAKLSSEDQGVVRKAARESVAVMRGLWEKREASSRAKAVAAGVNVIADIDLEAFAARMTPAWAPALKDAATARLVEEIKSMGGADA